MPVEVVLWVATLRVDVAPVTFRGENVAVVSLGRPALTARTTAPVKPLVRVTVTA